MKETTNIADLLSVVALLEEAGIKYWIDGGWGVDLLAGQQTREHRDIDIDFDATRTEELLDILVAKSYHISTDCRPVRIELYSHDHGYLDIHPFVINEDGSAKQASPEGDWYEFDADFFTEVDFMGKAIPCISLKAQKIFHSFYEPRDKDLLDLAVLERLAEGDDL